MNTEETIKRDNAYVLHTYARSPVALVAGEGMVARDAEGRQYLDFTSGIGVNSLGYCHPAWVRAVAGQAAALQHTSNLYYTEPCGALAQALCARTGLDAVFFGNSGAEANEGAIKCARKYSVDTYGPARNKVITLVNSFHGRTLATLTATGQDVFHHDFGPFPANFDYVPAGDFAALEKAADADTCAVMRCRRRQPGEGKRCSCQHFFGERILLLNPQLSANDFIADADVRQSPLHTNGNRDIFVIWLVALRRHNFMDIIIAVINPGPCCYAVGIRGQNGNLLTVFRLGPRISPRRFHQ